MFTSIVLSSVLGVGQVPAAQLPPVVPVMAPRPMVQSETPAPTDPNARGDKPATEEQKAEEPKPETKYFLEKLLAGTAAGSLLEERGIKVFGWTSGNFTGSSNTGSNLPITFNDFGNGGQLNQNWLEVNKAIDTSKKENQLGFRYATILPGTDYRFTVARGLGTVGTNDYGIDPMVYGYAEYFLPNFIGEGTTIRVGKWGTAIGYELIEATGTPFVTKSYNFQYNPFTHTGVQATTQLNENLSVYYGIVTGADVFIDPAGTATFVGGMKWAPKDGKNSLGINMMINNAEYNTAEAFANYNSYNAVFTHNITDKTQYLLDATWSFINNAPGIGYATWYGFANYLIHKHCNDKFVTTARFEIFEDAQGFRTGFAGTYFETTIGTAWQANDWLIVRPFARYDYNRNGPWQGDNNLYTGGIELIARW